MMEETTTKSRYILILTNKCYGACNCVGSHYGAEVRIMRSAYSRSCPQCNAGPGSNCVGAGLGGKMFCSERIDPDGYYASSRSDSLVILDVFAENEEAALKKYFAWCHRNGSRKDDLFTVIAAFRADPISFDGDSLRDTYLAKLLKAENDEIERREREQLAKLKAKYES